MRKRILVILLALLLCTGSVMHTEIRAEAAATTTVTVVSLAKAVLVLLAIAGVGISAGYAWENGEQIKEEVVATFTTWLQNHDPEFYTAFMLAGTNIAAGRVINTYDALFFGKLKQYTKEFFGTDTSVNTAIGSTTFNIADLAITANGSQRIEIPGIATINSVSNGIKYIPFYFTVLPDYRYCFFLPANYEQFGLLSANQMFSAYTAGRVTNLSYGTTTGVFADYWYFSGSSNMTFFNTKTTLPNSTVNTIRELMQSCINKLYSGQYDEVEEDVTAKPLLSEDGVAATSTEASVVSSGTLAREEDGEIVIDGDRTINLSGVNIDEWLKSLADGQATYADAMEEIGLSVVNTQTMTLEQIQSIAQALNPAAAGTGSITGNYTVALSDLFPFCIPFDLYNIVNCFKADPVAPSATITIPVGYDGSSFTWEDYEISLQAFDTVAAVVRVLEYVLFVIGLMLITRRLIEG